MDFLADGQKDDSTFVVDGSGKSLTEEEREQASKVGVTNDERVELLWLQEAVRFFETKEFPEMKVQSLDVENDLKSPSVKEKWRTLIGEYEKKVKDFNVGTMLRIDSSKDYTEENSVLVVRTQFYAIEIARNREGHNCLR